MRTPGRRLAAAGLAVSLLGVVALAGCRASGGLPAVSAFEPLPARTAPLVPDDTDRAARAVAAAALVAEPAEARRAAERLRRIDAERRRAGEAPSGLAALSLDAANATLDGARAYRRATRALLDGDEPLDPALRSRLEQSVADDPLELAAARRRDSRWLRWGRVFNTVASSGGRAFFSGAAAILSFSRSLLGLAVATHVEDAMSVPERQALAHWKRFLATDPQAPEAPEIAARIEREQARWSAMQRDRQLRRTRRALEHGSPAAALVSAERALAFAQEDREALALRDEAAQRVRRAQAQRARSLEAPAEGEVAPPQARRLALALLAPSGDVKAAARALLDAVPEGELADEARFALAVAQDERGAEDRAWRTLEGVAREDAERSNMARHAQALVFSAEQNPRRAFVAALRRDRRERAAWILFGPLGGGARDRDLPRALEWMIELPSYLDVLVSLPNRLVRYPWLEPWPFGRAPALLARRYLARHPGGAHAGELADWLGAFEERRGNPAAALELAEARGADPAQVAALRERAAQQALDAAQRETSRGMRAALLRRIARELQGTHAAQEAGELARRDAEQATPQSIRISRGFLRENPRVAGPEGLALRRELLDGDPRNGELHPDGVVLAGGRVLELRYVDASGDEERPALRVRQRVSGERIARSVSLLEETALRNARVDPDDVFAPDARRDLFFERARLGLAETQDPRPAASSSYAFLGMRERHGLVRGRESVLPIELVLQGSLPTLTLGAFPRLRLPPPTPDAILYR